VKKKKKKGELTSFVDWFGFQCWNCANCVMDGVVVQVG
jgi:hypothetical protein